MAVTVRQHAFSPKIADGFKEPTAKTLWYARGSDNEAAVIAAALATIPATFYNLTLKNIDYDNRGGGFWDIQANYEQADYIDGGGGLGDTAEPNTPPTSLTAPTGQDRVGPEFSAETSGGTAHITQSVVTQVSKKVGDPDGGPFTATDYKQAIGVSKDGIAGCDIPVGKLEFTITLKADFLTWDYIKLIKDLTGHTNSLPFLIFEEGEVVYLGGAPSYQSGDGWRFSHKFAAAKNEEEIVISDELTLKAADRGGDFVKLGWEYLWIEYIEKEVGGIIVQHPRAAYIETVLPSADLNQLWGGV